MNLPFHRAFSQFFKTGASRAPFHVNEAAAATWVAKWEVIMPVLVLVLIFGGFCTLVEASAVLVVYALNATSQTFRPSLPPAP